MAHLNLYLHIPFCSSRCHYCDFNTFTGQSHRQADYVAALTRELAQWGAAVRSNPALFGTPTTETIFFGGGTPSLLTPAQMQAILDQCRDSFLVDPDAEITIEANPGSVDLDYLRGVRAAGVNRISFGVQTFDDSQLQQIGREHDSAAARRAVTDARTAGFDNLNIDLIYGLPGQSLDHWRRTLEQALPLEVEHISTYGLTIEPATRFGKEHAAGRLPKLDPDIAADMYECTDEVLARGGYDRYEIANFSRPSRECRHNLTYWRNEPFLGLGAGGHSSTVRARFADHRPLARFIDRAATWHGPQFATGEAIPEADGPIDWVEPLDEVTQRGETMILGLRLAEGIDRTAFQQRHGLDPAEHWRETLDELAGYGMLEVSAYHIRLRPAGRLLADEIFARILARDSSDPRSH